MRIGIVGTGIAGLTAAWELRRAGASVTVFEKQNTLGMDAHSVSFDLDKNNLDKVEVRADVPSRMFNPALWPNLFKLYQSIGVETCLVDPSKSFSNLDQPALLRIRKSFAPTTAASLLLKPAARKIFKDIARMMNAAPEYLASTRANQRDQTMGEYLAFNQYSQAFIYQFLYPALSSTVCTCSYPSLDSYPATTLLSAMLNLTSPDCLLRTRNGTRDVVERLMGLDQEANQAQPAIDVQLSTAVRSAQQSKETVTVETDSGMTFHFDHLVVATQANAAMRIIDDLSVAEQNGLGSFRYENVAVVVHTDRSLMPARKKDWCTFNMISDESNSSAMCSIWMNKFYPEWQIKNGQPVFQTIMPIKPPREEAIVCQTAMQRPVVDKESIKGIELLDQSRRQLDRRIWFCGSYASPGIPLLESGVVSSQNTVSQIMARQKRISSNTAAV